MWSRGGSEGGGGGGEGRGEEKKKKMVMNIYKAVISNLQLISGMNPDQTNKNKIGKTKKFPVNCTHNKKSKQNK